MTTAAAGVAIFDQTGSLLLGRHTHDGRWATFGGAVEKGENPAAAAIREVAEEIGVVLSGIELLGSFGSDPRYVIQYPDGSIETYEVTMFCTVLAARPTVRLQTSEILEAQWFSQSTLPLRELATDMTDIVPTAFGWFRSRISGA